MSWPWKRQKKPIPCYSAWEMTECPGEPKCPYRCAVNQVNVHIEKGLALEPEPNALRWFRRLATDPTAAAEFVPLVSKMPTATLDPVKQALALWQKRQAEKAADDASRT